MIQFTALDAAWRDERARRLAKFRRLPGLAERGLELGAMTVLAKRTRDRWGAADLALDGGEARILALLAVAYWHPVSPSVIGNLRRAAKAFARGDQALAAIHIAHTGLAKIDEDERIAFRLFAAEQLLDAGVGPRELMIGLGLDPWPLDQIKFNPAEPRDEHGRWTDGGSGASPRLIPAVHSAPAGKNRDLSPEDGRQIVDVAKGWEETPYAPKHTQYAGPNATQGKSGGADCSGSVWAIYGQAGLNYRYTDTADFAAEAASGAIPFREVAEEDRQPGDVVLYPGPGHMSIYAGDDTVWGAHKPNLPFDQKPLKYFDERGGHRIYRYQVSDDNRGL
jgi:hypothetical protein